MLGAPENLLKLQTEFSSFISTIISANTIKQFGSQYIVEK